MKSPEEIEHKKIKKSLRYSILDGSFFSIMDSFTTPFITAYALFLNSSNIIVSLIASFPGLLASFFQLGAIKVEEMVSSRKLVVVLSVFLQAFLWLPVIFIPHFFAKEAQPWAFLVAVSLITMVGTFAGPFWKTLMGELVPENMRGSYFGKRNLIIGITSFIALYIAGFTLQHFSYKPIVAFSILFFVAFLARAISGYFISLMHENRSAFKTKLKQVGLFQFIRELPHDPYGRFVMFLCTFRIAIFISSPFMAVYMLKALKLSYFQFTILTSIEILASLLFLKIWGKFNDIRGSKNVILITGFMIPFTPLLWTFGHHFFYLCLLQFYSGMAYSGFNLATENFIFDATSPQERTRKVTYLNLLHGIAVFLGSITGGFLLKFITMPILFVISWLSRFTVAFFLLPTLREMRLVEMKFGKSMIEDYIYIRPCHSVYNSSMGECLFQNKIILGKNRNSLYADVSIRGKMPTFEAKKGLVIKPKPLISEKNKKYFQKKFIDRALNNAKKEDFE
jgi:MFS family permease